MNSITCENCLEDNKVSELYCASCWTYLWIVTDLNNVPKEFQTSLNLLK